MVGLLAGEDVEIDHDDETGLTEQGQGDNIMNNYTKHSQDQADNWLCLVQSNQCFIYTASCYSGLTETTQRRCPTHSS